MGPHFGLEAVPQMKTEKFSRKIHQFRVHKIDDLILRPENVRFRFSKLFHKRWPSISRTRPVITQEKKHRLTQTLSLVPRRALARAAGERRILLVCTHAQVPTATAGAETPHGGAPAIPTLIGSDKKSSYIHQRRQLSVLYSGLYTDTASSRKQY